MIYFRTYTTSFRHSAFTTLSSSYHAILDFCSPFLPAHYWDLFPTSQSIHWGSTLAIFSWPTRLYLRLGLHYPPFIRDYHPLPYLGCRTRYLSLRTMHPTFFILAYVPSSTVRFYTPSACLGLPPIIFVWDCAPYTFPLGLCTAVWFTLVIVSPVS
jgi:hypothetical protein